MGSWRICLHPKDSQKKRYGLFKFDTYVKLQPKKTQGFTPRRQLWCPNAPGNCPSTTQPLGQLTVHSSEASSSWAHYGGQGQTGHQRANKVHWCSKCLQLGKIIGWCKAGCSRRGTETTGSWEEERWLSVRRVREHFLGKVERDGLKDRWNFKGGGEFQKA